MPRFSVWVGDRHLFAPGGLALTDRALAVAWAAGYSRSVDAEVAVMDDGRVVATFRRATPPILDGDVRLVDRRARLPERAIPTG